MKKPNLGHLAPTDRASVLKIIAGWKNPEIIDLDAAKRQREIEASPDRQRGYRLDESPDLADAGAFLRMLMARPRETPSPVDMTDLMNRHIALHYDALQQAQLQIEPDPFRGTFVRRGKRRRQIYPKVENEWIWPEGLGDVFR